MPENHYVAAWEALVVKTPLPFMGTLPSVPLGHTNPDLETDIARQDHEEVSQNCAPAQTLVWMRPHQRHSRSSTILIEDGVITTPNMWPPWVTVTSAMSDSWWLHEIHFESSTLFSQVFICVTLTTSGLLHRSYSVQNLSSPLSTAVKSFKFTWTSWCVPAIMVCKGIKRNEG
jgi:hypothetical protein